MYILRPGYTLYKRINCIELRFNLIKHSPLYFSIFQMLTTWSPIPFVGNGIGLFIFVVNGINAFYYSGFGNLNFCVLGNPFVIYTWFVNGSKYFMWFGNGLFFLCDILLPFSLSISIFLVEIRLFLVLNNCFLMFPCASVILWLLSQMQTISESSVIWEMS